MLHVPNYVEFRTVVGVEETCRGLLYLRIKGRQGHGYSRIRRGSQRCCVTFVLAPVHMALVRWCRGDMVIRGDINDMQNKKVKIFPFQSFY